MTAHLSAKAHGEATFRRLLHLSGVSLGDDPRKRILRNKQKLRNVPPSRRDGAPRGFNIQRCCLFLKIRRHAVFGHLDVYRSADHPVVNETLHCHPERRFVSLTCRLVQVVAITSGVLHMENGIAGFGSIHAKADSNIRKPHSALVIPQA